METARHGSVVASTNRPGCEDGLVRSVLVEVDEDPFAAFLLPPGVGDQVGPAARQLAGDGHGGRTHREAVPLAEQAHVHVQPSVASGLDVRPHPQLVEQRVQLGGGLLSHREVGARAGIEVDAQLVAVGRGR